MTTAIDVTPIVQAITEHNLGSHEAALLWVICLSPPTNREGLMSASGIRTTRKLAQSLELLTHLGLVEKVRKRCVYDARTMREQCENATFLTCARVNNPTKVGESLRTSHPNGFADAKSAGADCTAIWIDGQLMVRVDDTPAADETMVLPLSEVRRPKQVAKYVDAWNKRMVLRHEWWSEKGVAPSSEDWQKEFDLAQWCFEFGTTNDPTSQWIQARWKQGNKQRRSAA